MNVLAINPGSSSLKFALFDSSKLEPDAAVVQGGISRLGKPNAQLELQGPEESREELGRVDLPEAVRRSVATVGKVAKIDALGFRVVHGGSKFTGPAAIDEASLAAIRELAPLAPLHNKADLEVIEAATGALPEIPAVAVFDTSFHRTLPPEAFTYALPADLIERYGIRRYGFHGISYQYVWDQLASSLNGGRLIACHLGSGASVCAIRNGESVDTSMGMTPLEGLVMGTRSGDVDPGVLLFLQREAGLSSEEIDDLLNHRSGLLGLSGIGSDTQDLEDAAAKGNAKAEAALRLFAYRVTKYIGAYAAVMGGLDALAFTGGIGEHSAKMRARICERLDFLGIRIADDSGSGVRQVGVPNGVPIWVVPAAEELQIAREVAAFL